MLDRVLELVRRNVDRQANLVVGQLLDAGGHGGIVAASLWATVRNARRNPCGLRRSLGQEEGRCGRRDSNPQGPKLTGT